MSISYKDSGVDKEEGYRSVEKIKERVKATYNKKCYERNWEVLELYIN